MDGNGLDTSYCIHIQIQYEYGILIYKYDLFHLVSEPLRSDKDVMFSFLGKTKISQTQRHASHALLSCPILLTNSFIGDSCHCWRSQLSCCLPTLRRNLKLCDLSTSMLYQWVDIDCVD